MTASGLITVFFRLCCLCLLLSCRERQSSEEPAVGTEIYILHRLPTGVNCQRLETSTLTDGSGCGILDASVAPPFAERLRFNLRKRASQQQANLVLIHEFAPGESREGCASNQTSARYSLYRCAFRRPSTFSE